MKKLLKVTALSGMLTLLKMLMGFVIAKVIATYTGPTGMAMLGQVQSMINSFNGIVNAPVSTGVVRFTAENHSSGYDKCSPWWRASLEWCIILCSILIPSGVFFSDILSEWLFKNIEYSWVISLTVIFLPLTAIGTLISSVINGLENYRRYILLMTISVTISSALMIILIIHLGIKGAFIAAALQTSMIGVVMLITNFKQPWLSLCFWWAKTSNKARWDITGYIFMAITAAITTPVALIIIRNILISQVGWDMAGQWQAVWKISEVYLSVLTIALSTYYLPKLSSLSGAASILKEINSTALVVIPFAALLALAVYLFRDLAIFILFTDEFKLARDLFLVQLCGDVVKISSWLYAYPMLSRGATKWFVTSEVLFSVSFVILSYFFISSYGVHGANYAYFLNYLFYLIFVVVNVRKFCK